MNELLTVIIFVHVPNRIPGTSYIKLFDIWQFVSLVVPFAEVLLHIVMDKLKSSDTNGTKIIRKVKPIDGSDEFEISQNKIQLDEMSLKTRKLVLVKKFATYGISLLYAVFITIFFTIPLFFN